MSEELEEEKAFEERRRKRLEKEEADRQARYEAIQRAEEEEEERKRAEQSQSSQKAVSMTDTKPVHTNSPPLTVAPLSTTTHDIQQPSTTIDTSNPYTKLQQPSVNTLQAEKPKERTDKREMTQTVTAGAITMKKNLKMRMSFQPLEVQRPWQESSLVF
ncbi:hypothetical protein G6F56_013314 [Rhizopus delemar]|nr:hypothetical protein G6F56_013314 [Rhizopus delemar]